MEQAFAILGLTTIGSLLGLGGGLLLIAKKSWGKGLSVHAVPLAAGAMLAVSLLDILPEAAEKVGSGVVFSTLLVVVVVAFFFEQFFMHIHHQEERTRTVVKSSLLLLVAGDTIHNFLDGLAIAAAYLTSPNLGILVAVATFLHEIPSEMGDFGLMLAGGWSRMRTILINGLSALAAYAGALVVIIFSAGNAQDSFGWLLAASGGLFLYIGASDLLPEIESQHKDKTWHQAGLLVAGVLVVWALTRLVSV
jgi:zinc and cadmium transporter